MLKKKTVIFTYFSSVETLSIYGYLVAYVDSLAKEARVRNNNYVITWRNAL